MGQGAGVGGAAQVLQQGVIVAEGDGPAGLLQAGDGGVVIIEQAVMAPGQGAFGSPALMAASKSTGPDSSARAVLHGEIEGGLVVGEGLNGGIETHGAGGDAHGQQKQDGDHRLGQIGGSGPG